MLREQKLLEIGRGVNWRKTRGNGGGGGKRVLMTSSQVLPIAYASRHFVLPKQYKYLQTRLFYGVNLAK